MRYLLLLAACLTLAGCASTPKGNPPLPSDTGASAAEIQKWIPLGTPAAQAQNVMEAHGFRCKIVPAKDNPANGNLMATAAWPADELLQTTWYCTLKLVDNKFSSVSVTITALGPAGNYQPSLPGSNLSPNFNTPP